MLKLNTRRSGASRDERRRSHRGLRRSYGLAALALIGALPVATAQTKSYDADVRGLVVAVNRATIASEISGSIIELPYREGESFAKGATLVAIDCDRYRAALAAAAAELRGARKTHANNKELAELNSIGRLEVDVSKAEVDRARANVAVLDNDVRDCTIVAPFAGRVVERSAQLHESVSRGDELLSILDDKTLEIELIVPSSWLRWLRAGSPFEFTIDETGVTHPAKVARVGAAIDPESQTIKVYGALAATPDSVVLSGMSGAALFVDSADSES